MKTKLLIGLFVLAASATTYAVATGWCLGFAVVPWLVLLTAFGNV